MGGAAAVIGGELAVEKRIIRAAENCTSTTVLRRLYGFLVRRHHRLRNPSLILAKLLLFAAISPSGNLSLSSKLLFHDLHREEIHHSAFFFNTLMRGFTLCSDTSLAIALFKRMRSRSVLPDQFSFTFLLKARAKSSPDLTVQDVHSLALKHGCLNRSSIHVYNGLIHYYAIGGNSKYARQIFDEMPNRDVVSWSGLLTAELAVGNLNGARRVFDLMPMKDLVSWTAMICGYSQHGQPIQALSLFKSLPSDLTPDEITLIGVLSACGATGDIAAGAVIHRHVDENNLTMVPLRNALIDMYAKCGSTEIARKLFDEMHERNTITYNSMISAYGLQGDVIEALKLLQEMPSPDEASFLGALNACAHSGAVDEGKSVVEAMKKLGFEPGDEHYGCLVDMLGRAGRLEEAYELATAVKVNHVVLGALLGGCRIHGNVMIAEKVMGELMRLRPEDRGYRLLLAGVYAAAGRQEEAGEIRRRMVDEGTVKVAAHSTLRLSSS